MERLIRRAELPVAMSEGFHPKQRVSYVSALALGYSSGDEVMEILFEREMPTDEILRRLSEAGVSGLEFTRAEILPEGGKKSAAVSFLYDVPIPAERAGMLAEKIAAFESAESVPATKTNGKTVDLKPAVLSLAWSDGSLRVRFAVQNGPEASVRELLSYFGLENELFRTIFPRRVETALAD